MKVCEAVFVQRTNELVEKTGMTKKAFAKALDMNYDITIAVLSGRTAPRLSELVAIADYFAVPMDFLTGRCTEEEARSILAGYSRTFMELRRAPFEAYLTGRKALKVEDGVEEPWPYNLLHNVMRRPWSRVVTKEHEALIFKAIGLLPYRERRVILAYHQDGKDLKALAAELAITPERVRLFLNKGIKTLRTEALRRLMEGGPEGTFVSVWEGGITVATPCRVDFDRKVVFDVVRAEVDGLGSLVDQYVIIDGRRYTVGENDEELKLVW